MQARFGERGWENLHGAIRARRPAPTPSGAIGRALAMLGYGTQFTGDELNEEHRIVDAVRREGSQEMARQAS